MLKKRTRLRSRPPAPNHSGDPTLANDSTTNERARRALSQRGGIDGILFMLLAGAGTVVVVGLLIFGLSAAESNAERDAEHTQPTGKLDPSEFGTN